MDILKILDTQRGILANIDMLAKTYKEVTGRNLNRGCPACVNEMILTLKNHFKMTNFRLAKAKAQYKNKKGDKTTISNSTMTDKKALAFLRTNPERIKLFSEYPDNWEELTEQKELTEEEEQNKIAIQAEMQAAELAKKSESSEKGEQEEETEEEDSSEPEEGKYVNGMSRGEHLLKSLKELKALYPNIKATKTEDFVDKVFA